VANESFCWININMHNQWLQMRKLQDAKICLMPWNTACYSCRILWSWSQAIWRRCPDLV